MLTSISLMTLILGEIIFLLTILIIFLCLFIKRQRQQHNLVLHEYRKSVSQRSGLAPAKLAESVNKVKAFPDPIDTFLENTKNDALARYQQSANAKLPRLSAELPFSAKIAALRYFFIRAESELRQQPTVDNESWMLLEKKLAEVARWIGTPKKLPFQFPSSRLRKLQETIDILKPFEAENHQLRKQLESSQNKQKKMKEFEVESKDALIRMQKIIQVLQLANTYKGENIDDRVRDALQLSDRDHHPLAGDRKYQASTHQLDHIADISERKSSLLKKMVEDLPYTYIDLAPEQRQKMENLIRALERDLLKSDHQISSLQKSLKDARDSLEEKPLAITEKPVTPFNKYSPSKLTPPGKISDLAYIAPKPESDTLTIIHNQEYQEKNLEPKPNSWIMQGGRERTLEEIQQLRSNNQSQRNIIVDLEKELRSLRQAMNETSDENEKAEKSKDISRLEKLVKECEYCIEALESEVDMLHAQLEQHASGSPAEEPSYPEVSELHKELEVISGKLQNTIKQHSQTSIINHFVLNVLNCKSLEDMSKAIIKTLKDLHVLSGFYLYSSLGKAEYYTSKRFTPSEQKILKKFGDTSPIAYLNEGILFARSGIRIILKDPPENDDLQMQIENTLNDIAVITSHRLKNMESDKKHARHSNHVDAWVDKAKHKLTELNSQHMNLVSENNDIVTDLIKELTHAINMVDMTNSARIVFDNAIGECHQRLKLTSESSKLLTRDSAQLIGDIEHLRYADDETAEVVV